MMNTRSNHQLIQREQTYVLDRKLVSFHSNDRDIRKWPHSNHFEVTLPETVTNIDSMKLTEIKLPSNYYSFSNELQNTKMSFSITSVNAGWSVSIQNLLSNADPFVITIQSGFYNPNQLASELTYRLNKAVTDYLIANGEPASTVYDQFVVFNDEVAMKFWFGNKTEGFSLLFDARMDYTLQQCEQPTAWDRYSEWGLGSYLGFNKFSYVSTVSNSELVAGWTTPVTKWLPFSAAPAPASTTVNYVQAPLVYKLLGESTIYMEVEKYNHIDELVPFSQNTNGYYNNDFNGVVNAAFAKIPVTVLPYGQFFESANGIIISSTHFDPPLERIQKLKFRFRNHVGALIDFQDFPFNFTIEFNCLRNEIGKSYSIRVPSVYSF